MVATTTSRDNISDLQSQVPNRQLDLYQERDWPHRSGDPIDISLHSFPLTNSSPGRRSVACERCSSGCQCVQDNVLCWNCKGCYCFNCTTSHIGGPNGIMRLDPDRLLGLGWGACPRCSEPFRSLALPAVFRGIIGSMRMQPSGLPDIYSAGSAILVREAEDALRRGEDEIDKMKQNDDDRAPDGASSSNSSSHRARAVLELTHAFNAINYLASESLGRRLIMRPRDVLIIAHAKRARLEGRRDLYRAIVDAFPKASVRVPTNVPRTSPRTGTSAAGGDAAGMQQPDDGPAVPSREREWFLSTSAFRSLFYPLPASWMAGGGDGGGLICTDMRTSSKQEAYASPSFAAQMRLVGGNWGHVEMMKSSIPSVDGADYDFESLRGTYKGATVQSWQGRRRPTIGVLGAQKEFVQIMQFAHAFPSALASSEYLRIRVENGRVGEERGPLNSRRDPSASDSLREACLDLGAKGIGKVHVLTGTGAGISGAGQPFGVSVMTSVYNVCTKIFVADMVQDPEQSSRHLQGAIRFAARAIAYMSVQVKSTRSIDASECIKAPSHSVDLTVCAFCGLDENSIGGDEKKLLRCTCCKTSYCSSGCQRAHWTTKGGFGHRKACKERKEFRRETEEARRVVVLPLVDMDDITDSMGRGATGEDDVRYGEDTTPGLGERVRIDGLQSAVGNGMNGKDALVLSHPNASGRVQVVLVDELKPDEVERVESGQRSWVQDGRKKSMKLSNLRRIS